MSSSLPFRVSFATSCSPEAEPEAAREFPFYELIAEAIHNQTSIKPFLPHRDLSTLLTPHQKYDIIRKRIEDSHLVVADIASPSSDAGVMIVIGHNLKIPILPFYRTNLRNLIDPRIRGMLEVNPDTLLPADYNLPSIEIVTNEQGVRDISQAVKNYFS